MEKRRETSCIICGKETEQKARGRGRKYCNEKCRNYYHNRRNANKQKQPSGKAKCQHCGKEFIRAVNSTRKCCSSKCEQALGRQAEIKDIRQMAAEEKKQKRIIELRSFALELYYKGYNRTAIKEALELSSRTLPHWIERYTKDIHGNWVRKPGSRQSGRSRQGSEIDYSYREAETAEEWLTMLRERTIGANCLGETIITNRPIYIVCGITNIRKSADHLSSIVQARLQMNPFDGAVYVFCGKERDKIRYIYWDGSGFNIVLRRCERGTYPWPSPKIGLTFAISPQDFELIFRGIKRTKPIYDWDCIDLYNDKKAK